MIKLIFRKKFSKSARNPFFPSAYRLTLKNLSALSLLRFQQKYILLFYFHCCLRYPASGMMKYVNLKWQDDRPGFFSPIILYIKTYKQKKNYRLNIDISRYWDGMRPSALGTSATNWPIVPAPDDRRVRRVWWKENWQGKPKYSEKTCPSATLSATNSIWPDLRWNPDWRLTAQATARPRCIPLVVLKTLTLWRCCQLAWEPRRQGFPPPTQSIHILQSSVNNTNRSITSVIQQRVLKTLDAR
jgi:hypothetical protein